MNIPVLKDLITVDSKHELIKLYYHINYVCKGKDITSSELDIIAYMVISGGYTNKEGCEKFLEDCLNKGFKKSIQSIRNSLSKLTKMGVLSKDGNNKRKVSDSKLPSSDVFGLEYFVTNLELNADKS